MELGFQARDHELVHLNVSPVKPNTTDAILDICLPPNLHSMGFVIDLIVIWQEVLLKMPHAVQPSLRHHTLEES
jgi:hypothetical protein